MTKRSTDVFYWPFTCKPGSNQINPERTGLRLGTERHCSCLVECQRLFRDPAPPAFAPVRGFGGDGGRRRSKPNKGSQRCHRENGRQSGQQTAARWMIEEIPA